MTELREPIPFHDFITEVETSPAFSNILRNSELILDDNDGDLGIHQIFEINIKDDDNENITIEMNEKPNKNGAKPNDDKALSDKIHNQNINQEIINYVYENLLPQEANNQTSSNNFDINDKVLSKLTTTPKNEQLNGNGERKPSSNTTLGEIHERNCTIIKKDENKLSLQNPVLVEGKCFISNDSIYFVSAFSQILKNSSVVRIKCESILSTKKAQKFNIIPKSLKIKQEETQSFAFTILLDKDNTYDSISNIIQHPINSKQKLEINPIPHNKKQNNNLDLDHIKPSPVFSENLLITKDINNMISMNIYPEEIQLLKEKEFYTDLKYLTSLYINKDFKDLYYNVFSKAHSNNPLYQFSSQMDPQGIDYDQFNQLPDTIQTPSVYSFNLKYNASLETIKQKLYTSFMLPSRIDVDQTIKLFFFHNCIILQTQIKFLTKIPFLNSARSIITVIIHNIPSENDIGKNNTQIDVLYAVYFFKHKYFENKIITSLLPLIESMVLEFKVYINECIRDIYKDKAFRETPIQITNINNIFRTTTTTNNSTTNNSTTDNSTTNNSTTSNSTTSNSTTNNSTTSNSTTSNSTTNNSTTSNSTTNNSTTNNSTTSNSTTNNSTTSNSTTNNSTTNNSTTNNSTTNNSTTNNSTTNNSTTNNSTTNNSSCITNNQKYKHPDAKNKTLAGFKNQITNPQNNKIVIKTKHFENILPDYINKEIHINPTLTPSNKTPKFLLTSITILMYIYMNFIQNLRN
ncbi:conserved Plasmodium protein, unknown function [Plasmodium yoelii]|uniref:GRAM domain-containing protein n=1 Tax=Plasmodium yoelii TaxID=5861 RepID=A0A4V0KHT3_PLAYE|nr:conserved Plasmodium protein, unknown function [Plasmodium yoelii]VTZ75112.1 conserved Plasmodium protein, unknown function [Plasmodium yoelii]|eukprot:XP_022813107.2 conserved Plasmodium protein, unknown function [Plasmodium yoelii]